MVACGYAARTVDPEELNCFRHSNEALRLQPAVPSGSQRTVGKGKGAKMLETL